MTLTLTELTAPLGGTETIVTTGDGTRLRTEALGEGPTIVMAHGYSGSAMEWTVAAKRLVARGRRVIVFDQRGHGASSIGRQGITSQSMASDYKAILEHYGVEDGVIIGHSMGGFLLVRFLLLYPEAVKKHLRHAVIFASFAGDIGRNSFQNKLQIPMIRSGIIPRLVRRFPAVGRAFTKSLCGDGYTDAYAEAFIPVFLSTNHSALWHIMKAFENESYYEELGNISVPCTVMVGDKDKTTPAFHSRDMARLIPKAELVILPGAGHLANWEAADALVSRLLEVSAAPAAREAAGAAE